MKFKYFAVLLFVILAHLMLIRESVAAQDETPYKIGVNRFAWYAALKLINFMPLSSADPFSGVIITDWYYISDNERYKVDVYVLEEHLTSNTVEVKVFKEINKSNTWRMAKLNPKIAIKLEDAILNTARQLRIQYMLSEK